MYFNFVILLFFCLTLIEEISCKGRELLTNDGGKIVGGYNTTIRKIPYQVYLLIQRGNNYYRCGGSIISTRYVLTAAHCLKGKQVAFIRTGSTNTNFGGRVYTSSTFVQHPKYNASSYDYDFAIIKLSTDIVIDGTNTKVVKLAPANTSVKPGTTVVVSGWGATSENGPSSSILRAVKVQTISSTRCQTTYSGITPRMFCAGDLQGGKDSCQGDSGGPSVNDATGVQLGVVSFGIGCARPGYPGVYADISSVRDWIQTTTGV